MSSRAQMVLWRDEEYSVAEIARMAGVSRPTVYLWLSRSADDLVRYVPRKESDIRMSELPRFNGMAAWLPETEIIECRGTALGTVDLHNESDLICAQIETSEAGLSLAYTFKRVGPAISTERFQLRFSAITGAQGTAGGVNGSNGLGLSHAIDFSIHEEGQGYFEVDTGAFEAQFSASSVLFVV